MPKILFLLMSIVVGLATQSAAAAPAFSFANIDGGTHDLTEWRGQPVLVVNTASRCGYTPQYEALQSLQDQYADQGLVVLTVPSNDFRQELASAEAVKEFCETTFGLTLPMTDITRVTGPDAHPFYRWLADSHNITPRWNFNKVLLDPTGTPVASFGSSTRPLSKPILDAIAPYLQD